jgi:hypothetical protein
VSLAEPVAELTLGPIIAKIFSRASSDSFFDQAFVFWSIFAARGFYSLGI